MSKKFSNGFYFRCVSCNDSLDTHYQRVGLCSICNRIVNKASNPDYIEEDNTFVEHMLWKNPMDGGMLGEDVEMDYQGTKYDIDAQTIKSM